MATPSSPSFEHHREALGIGEAAPRLSWKTRAEPGWAQSAYEIEIVRDGRAHATGRIDSPDSVLVPWPIDPLGSRERADVRVRVWGTDQEPSEWSTVAAVETGLLHPSDWIAVPVGGAWPEQADSDDRRPAIVRREFTVGPDLVRARLYATAHGLAEAELNGHRVGDDTLSPGWTVYGSRLRYLTYDVTDLLQPGANALGAWLGDGCTEVDSGGAAGSAISTGPTCRTSLSSN